MIENNRKTNEYNIEYITEKDILKQNQWMKPIKESMNETNQSNKSKMRIEFNKMENKGIELKSTKQNSI